jgi:hypothetical protein
MSEDAMKKLLLVCCAGLLAVPLCPGSVGRTQPAVPQTLAPTRPKALKTAARRPTPRRSAKAQPDEPVLIILYGDHSSWM